MVARASNYAALGHGWLLAQYVVAYSCFLLGACISGMLINYETFYLGRNYGRALFMVCVLCVRWECARCACALGVCHMHVCVCVCAIERDDRLPARR
jgi:hypothetical protein